jgi:cytoskeletal protein CcmA (bactofilin family)
MPLATPAPPPKAQEPELPRGVASIGKSVVIKGQIFSREDLYLDGEIEGTVEVPENRLTVGPHGKLQATIRAREVVVLGAVQGNVEASERIDIRKDSKLVGDIKTGRIIIEDGAYFKGSIDIVKAEAAKPAVAVRPAAAEALALPAHTVGEPKL